MQHKMQLRAHRAYKRAQATAERKRYFQMILAGIKCKNHFFFR